MSAQPLNVAIITGSALQGRFSPVVTDWFAARARDRQDMAIDVVDLADTPIAQGFAAAPDPGLADRLAAADAFVVITPEYNHSFPAPLKHAIDQHVTEWQAKPVAFISYGGISGGLRAIEQLRLVFAELHAVTIRDTVSFHRIWECFDGTGSPKDPEADTAADLLLDRLAWWGRALRRARAETPYGS
ncbi:NADPH-dependent FMN reductase [Thermomonospora cellulosilytica]|uniref:NAD(P)H-dependent FMN reductase n=1 Tax=Thermomonospora cellulosilytica TaxID=1411118 RepID=A0A7W3MU85_9ACTN|nr:NAD(P)H-dependent oxidoreductase [Thermomonospora cellulosilytica]MBA9001927.1 NAD(P)H-dependent FMN reductase [Thermomonospora cellulosilytica]